MIPLQLLRVCTISCSCIVYIMRRLLCTERGGGREGGREREGERERDGRT